MKKYRGKDKKPKYGKSDKENEQRCQTEGGGDPLQQLGVVDITSLW